MIFDTPFSAEDLAQALEELGKAGLTAEQASEGALDAALALAAGSIA
jgi:hypothetical protein